MKFINYIIEVKDWSNVRPSIVHCRYIDMRNSSHEPVIMEGWIHRPNPTFEHATQPGCLKVYQSRLMSKLLWLVRAESKTKHAEDSSHGRVGQYVRHCTSQFNEYHNRRTFVLQIPNEDRETSSYTHAQSLHTYIWERSSDCQASSCPMLEPWYVHIDPAGESWTEQTPERGPWINSGWNKVGMIVKCFKASVEPNHDYVIRYVWYCTYIHPIILQR